MSGGGWTVAGEKNKTRRRQAKQNKFSTVPIPLNVDDWTDRFSELDQAIYNVFKKNHPTKMSPENVLFQLKKSPSSSGTTIKQVWASLDSACMKRYIYRASHVDWALVTAKMGDEVCFIVVLCIGALVFVVVVVLTIVFPKQSD